jgi:regulator of chromosome condensation (RCC1) repeat-containing protein/integrase family protein with SAM-like domain
MSVLDPCLLRSRDPAGEPVARLGVPLVDDYLEFLQGRCRPNTVLAAAYDLKVFLTVVAKPLDEVRPADVLAFITAQRTGRATADGVVQPMDSDTEPVGVSSSTVARRLSMISGLFSFLQVRGDIAANPVPRGLPTRRATTAAGFQHTCGVRTDGTAWCWGPNSSGQLGDGTQQSHDVPVQVGHATSWTSVALGIYHTCATRAAGTLWCWGANTYWDLGDGTDMLQQLRPVRVFGFKTATSFGAGYAHTCATKADDTMWYWGYNHFGQLGVGDQETRKLPTRVNR